MKYVFGLITAFFQLIVGYSILIVGGFGLALLINELGLVGPENTNPWWNTPSQFIFFVLSSSFGVWIIGLLAAKLRKLNFDGRKTWWGTLAASAIAIILITIVYLIQGAVGFMPILFAVVVAVLGYYLHPYLWR